MPVPNLPSLTSYTKVDTPGRISLTETRATGTGIRRTETNYAYWDGGANWVNDIELYFSIYVDSSTAADDALISSGFTVSAVGAVQSWGSTDIQIRLDTVSGTRRVRLIRGAGGASDDFTILQNTQYFCVLRRGAASDTVTLEVYSDAARSTLLDTLSLSGFGGSTRYRYHYAIANYADSFSNNIITGWFDFSQASGWWYFF